MNDPKMNGLIRALAKRQKATEERFSVLLAKYEEFVQACEEQPRSITEEIDSIPGRRIFYHLVDRADFTAEQDGLRADPLTFLVSQDGPFVMTHYPLVTWKPNLPTNATHFGRWRPVSSWPLPDQVLDDDIIDLSYEFTDGGSQRNFQNEPAGAGPFSRPDNFVPLPVPTLFAPNSTLQFFPTYDNILFSTPAEPTTGGELSVTLIGYRIANL
jgi:hypothetical protein